MRASENRSTWLKRFLAQADRKKYLLIALKLAISLLLLGLIFRKAGLLNILEHLSSIKISYFILSSAIYIFATYISSFRWGMLLDEKYPVKRLFSLYMIGSFFNNILPGMIGGDAVKAYYLYSDTRKGASSFGSVFMDRYTGYVALLMIGLVAEIIAFRDLVALKMQWALPVLAGLFVAGSVAVFGIRMGKRFHALAAFYDYFHMYIKKKSVMVKAIALSLIIQFSGIVMVFVIARGIGQRPSFEALFVFVPIIVTLMSIPISISGFGVREGGFVILFGMTGVSPEASVSIAFLWFLSYAAASLIGFVLYLRHKKTDLDGSPRHQRED